MTNDTKLDLHGQPESEKVSDEIKIPIKFNKETIELSLSEAAELAQKGMKYDQVSNDLKRLRYLAAKDGKSITAFLTFLEDDRRNDRKAQLLASCGGDEELVDHIMKLESQDMTDNGFAELKAQFPELDSPEKLPESVLEAAQLKGTNLLDEYLRYLLLEERKGQQQAEKRKKTQKASIGSQLAFGADRDPANAAFLQGLWRN